MNKFLIGLTVMFLSLFAQAQQDIYTSFASSTAIKGYDPVAYFTQNDSVKGDDDFSFEYKGATWLFASEENLNLFKETPEKYTPQYGGYCAFAMAQGKKVKVNPKNFSIIDDKLYLNYNTKVQNQWLEDTDGFILKADQKWDEHAE